MVLPGKPDEGRLMEEVRWMLCLAGPLLASRCCHPVACVHTQVQAQLRMQLVQEFYQVRSLCMLKASSCALVILMILPHGFRPHRVADGSRQVLQDVHIFTWVKP
jgi:hypothetical protein